MTLAVFPMHHAVLKSGLTCLPPAQAYVILCFLYKEKVLAQFWLSTM